MELQRLESIHRAYLRREQPFLWLSLIIPLLFAISQFLLFHTITSYRHLLPPEFRGLAVMIATLLLILINLGYYLRFRSLVTNSPMLTQTIYHFSDYKRRVSRITGLIAVTSFLYIIVYFWGFLLLQLRWRPPRNPPAIPVKAGGLIFALIYLSFALQLLYLVLAYRHMRRWRRTGQKLNEFENSNPFEVEES